MHKIFSLFIAALFIGTSAFAQLKTNKGQEILPQKGDLAVGVYNDDDFTITMKKVVEADKHKRYRLRLGYNSTSEVFKVQDDIQTANNPNASVLVDDKVTTSVTDIMFLYGIEKRKGNGRMQGFYGGEGGVGISNTTIKHDFANGFVSENVFAPSTSIPGQDGIFPRTTEANLGTGLNFELKGIVGAEFFFLEKLSVGLEWAWGLELQTRGEGKVKTEEWDDVNSQKVSLTTNTGKLTSVTFGSDNIEQRVKLLFYF
ncbi:MAG: hypothetical protein HKO56_07720 [Bacteroidia bacterium]|nr:hypothetical protein [Bacteroidia bacterium]NNC85317.1 hypothetical protein [Bacteroidia bacterium]NNM16528.1 hypothetical protein [Bacteroidia bacterium]